MTAKVIIFISIGILLCSAAGAGFLWFPKIQSYFMLEQQLSAIDAQLEEKLQYFSKLEEVQANLDDYRESLTKIDSAFPSDPNVSVPPLIVYMLKITAESGVTVKDVDIGTALGEINEKGLSETKFDLAGTGASYAVFKNLLNTIYNSARMIDVDSISMTSPSFDKVKEGSSAVKEGDAQKQEEYQFSMSLKTNFYPEKEEAKNPSAPTGGVSNPNLP